MSSTGRFRVVIAGGGVAALETMMALHALAGGRVAVQIVAPNNEFSYRPLAVGEPFGHPSAARYPLAPMVAAAGAELVADGLSSIDPVAQVVQTNAGLVLPYDALVVAVGARMHAAFPNAVTIDDRLIDEQLHGLVQDIERGQVKSVAFVAPARMPWPLPIYELALMTTRRADDMGVELDVTLVTPEDAPLAIFGTQASDAISTLLADAGVETITSATAQVPKPGFVTIRPGQRTIRVDRIVAMPELMGAAVRGLPLAPHGFLPIDRHCAVRGVDRVFAAGDVTDFAVKHGGISAQQADAAAEAIAALAGAPLTPARFDPVICGILLTGGPPKFLTARVTGRRGFSSEITDEPTWAPVAKISAHYLAPYIEGASRSRKSHAVPPSDAIVARSSP